MTKNLLINPNMVALGVTRNNVWHINYWIRMLQLQLSDCHKIATLMVFDSVLKNELLLLGLFSDKDPVLVKGKSGCRYECCDTWLSHSCGHFITLPGHVKTQSSVCDSEWGSGELKHWHFQLPKSINRRPVNNPGRHCDLALVSNMKTSESDCVIFNRQHVCQQL